MKKLICEAAALVQNAADLHIATYLVKWITDSFDGTRKLELKKDSQATITHPDAPSEVREKILWRLLEEDYDLELNDQVLVVFGPDWKVLDLFFILKEVFPC